MNHNINEIYFNYLNGLINTDKLESSLYAFLLKNQEKTCLSHWARDKYEDFLSWFYPRLKKCIDSYKDKGASFDAFINKFLLVASREYYTRNLINSVTEYSTWSARIPDMYAHEEPPVYKYKEINSDTESFISKMTVYSKNGRQSKQRILALILKCYYYISDDYADKIAPLIGMKEKDLQKLINKIKEKRQNKDDCIYQLKERIFCQYYRCMVYHKRMSVINEETITHKRLKIRLEKARVRLEKMRIRLANVRTEATNKQIADVIGVKKGTVDSSLFRLKMQWREMAKKAALN